MPELKDWEGLDGLQKKKDHHNRSRYGIRFIYTFVCTHPLREGPFCKNKGEPDGSITTAAFSARCGVLLLAVLPV